MALANCDFLTSKDNSVKIQSSTERGIECFWKYEAQHFHSGIFLKLGQNKLINVSTGDCLADVWPNGNLSGMELYTSYIRVCRRERGVNSSFVALVGKIFALLRIRTV